MELTKTVKAAFENARERRRHKYEFEELSVRDKGKNPDDVLKEMQTLISRFGISSSILKSETYFDLQDYIRMFHCNISWYTQKINKVTKKKNIYFWIGIALLILIPLLVFGLTGLNQGKITPSSVGAIITLFLTIILALYKASAIWLESKRYEGLFWQASSNLKNRLYSLEDKWEGKIRKTNIDNFVEELKLEILEGRKIVQEETQAFFENYTTPILDVPGILSSTNAQAISLLNAFQAPSFKGKLEEESKKLKNELKLSDNLKQIEFLKKKQKLLIAEIERLSNYLQKETDQNKIDSLIAEKEVLESELKTGVYEIMVKKAEKVLYE
ncbi:MAG: hypothetical protein AAF849_09685 [Bacteroidota bacterium]